MLCLIANTSPVAYGALGLPLLTLEKVTDLPAERLSVMAVHQLPLLSCIVPFWMVKSLWTWRQTWAVWPILAVAGGSFALFQLHVRYDPSRRARAGVVSTDRHRRWVV